MKRAFVGLVVLSVFASLATMPSLAATPRAAVRPLAPVIVSAVVSQPTKLVVNYKLDSAYKSRIRLVQYSINGGKSWRATTKSPIVVTGLKAATRYSFRLRQVSKSGRVVTLSRSYVTAPAVPVDPSIETPVIPGFTVQNLLWSDEFNTGARIDASRWTARYCGRSGANGGGTCHNNESQWYIPEAIAVADGNAVITTTRVTSAPGGGALCFGTSCAFTSGRFDTQGKVSFQYGYIEARIKMPSGQGNWPAFWMIGTDIPSVGWPVSGEMDIAEQGGHQPRRNSAALHYSNTTEGCCANHLYEWGEFIADVDLSADFHTYGIAWTPNQMTLLMDRVPFWTVTKDSIRSQYWPGNKPYFLILNNAIGPREGGFGGLWGDWQTAQMTIDYVRAFALDGQGVVKIG